MTRLETARDIGTNITTLLSDESDGEEFVTNIETPTNNSSSRQDSVLIITG